ncbi:P-loop containing nucleoside triphosphate hydrolase protein [Blastocladiella britannica]|nr:P-loop containing nucleoside triphosphate hydrolase protein [Blastocladiella britannica]
MGHVDHGKTTLLDTLRKTAVAAGEAGGITQHIGAFESTQFLFAKRQERANGPKFKVTLPGGKITFLDTPGHSAFETMRARGANVTDIVVLVVAADDGVMPQTKEAIRHAKAAGVPIIVAVNKCDKHGINKDRIKNQLLEHDIHVEDLGGDTMCVEISALKGTGLDVLEESILTLAELQDIRADPTSFADGVTLESQVKKGKGATATVLIKDGTLRTGDIVVAGTAWCKVRSMNDDQGKSLTVAPPATPVEVLGWKDLPAAGERVVQVPSEDAAKKAVDARSRALDRARQAESVETINVARMDASRRAAEVAKTTRRSQRSYAAAAAANAATEGEHGGENGRALPVSLFVKADVSGSAEALVDALHAVGHPELAISVVASGIGPVTESDIERAYAATSLVPGATSATTQPRSVGYVLGFNVKPDKKAIALAKRHGVTVLSHNVIYRLLDSFKAEMGKLLTPELIEEEVGHATVAQVFELNGKGGSTDKVAGCKVTSGSLHRANEVKIMRSGKPVWTGKLKMIRHFKKEVHEIGNGNECGLGMDGFDEFEEGDTVVSIKKSTKPRVLA